MAAWGRSARAGDVDGQDPLSPQRYDEPGTARIVRLTEREATSNRAAYPPAVEDVFSADRSDRPERPPTRMTV